MQIRELRCRRENLIRYRISRFPVTDGRYDHLGDRPIGEDDARTKGKERDGEYDAH